MDASKREKEKTETETDISIGRIREEDRIVRCFDFRSVSNHIPSIYLSLCWSTGVRSLVVVRLVGPSCCLPSIFEDSGMITGRKERVEGAMGVISMHGTEGATMAPPTARLYPVEPLGVLMIRPSP